MDRFIENAEAVSERFDCLALAVHHQPWDAKRMRGHSSSAGASVATMRAEKAGKLETKLFVEEAKDDEDELAFAVQFRSSRWATAKPTSARPPLCSSMPSRPTPSPTARRPRKSGSRLTTSSWLASTITRRKGPVTWPQNTPNQNLTHVTHFRDELVTWGVTGDKGTSGERMAWKRIKETLQKKGLLRIYKTLCWHPVTSKKRM